MKFGMTFRYCPGHFPGTIGIEKAGLDHRQIVVMLEKVAVKLPQHLGDLIRRTQVQRHEFFGEGQRGAAAIDRTAGGGVNKAFDSGKMGILREFQGAQAIDQQVGFRMVDGILVGEQRGQVKDHVRPFKKDSLQLHFIQDAAFHEQDIGQGRHIPAGRRR